MSTWQYNWSEGLHKCRQRNSTPLLFVKKLVCTLRSASIETQMLQELNCFVVGHRVLPSFINKSEEVVKVAELQLGFVSSQLYKHLQLGLIRSLLPGRSLLSRRRRGCCSLISGICSRCCCRCLCLSGWWEDGRSRRGRWNPGRWPWRAVFDVLMMNVSTKDTSQVIVCQPHIFQREKALQVFSTGEVESSKEDLHICSIHFSPLVELQNPEAVLHSGEPLSHLYAYLVA
mmetsp:Transcript_32938/g.60263  ORF Transcript_32938/g.60263 Transcript_32938/m.60263 type:complete len:230 (+) Transcript_32938:1008-1697(+)